MKPVDFDYARPASIAEAMAWLGKSNGMAKIMAGGQTLGPMLNLRFVQPELILDVTRVAELKQVEVNHPTNAPSSLRIGACTTHAAIEDAAVSDVTRGMLTRVASRIAYRAVRTRGTIGGSIAHADPAADWLSSLTALRALVATVSPKGRREVPIDQFVKGPLETDLAEDEIIEAVVVHGLSAQARWGYHKICRKTGEFAEAIGAVVIDRDRCRIVVGATPSRPLVIDLAASDDLVVRPDAAAISARLRSAGFEGDTYETNIHTAAVLRAIQEAAEA